jgi:O-antigen/teichoic acid export membrane protein
VDHAIAGQVAASGEHETLLARNYIARQTSHVVALLIALGVITVLARRLPLSELGTYALLLSLTTYLVVLQGVVETAAIKSLAEAVDERARTGAFSTVLFAYVAAGLLAAAIVAGLGLLLLDVWTIPPSLRHDARMAVGALAILMLVSWPFRTYYDTLRARQLFGRAAIADIVSAACGGGAVIAFVLAGAPLWLIVSAAASGSLVTGVASAVIVRSQRLPYHFARHAVTRSQIRAFAGVSSWFLLASLSTFVIYQLDRTILAAFRPAATVGLYEGPIRAHNLVLDVQASLVSPVLPAAARYAAERDAQRQRELLVRGTRYTMAVIVPIAVVLMILARPILEAWLGRPFGAAAPAMAIIVGYWLVYANTSVGWTLIVAAGQIRRFAIFAAVLALANAALSLALTPSLGLNGVVLGTAIPAVLALPVFLRMVPPQFNVELRELAREVWIPAYSTGAVVAAGLLAVRLAVDLANVAACTGAAAAALLMYWSIYYLVWLRPSERRLVRTLAHVS